MKYLFVYFTHVWNDRIKARYYEIQSSLRKCDNIDILLMYSNRITDDLSNEIEDKCFKYENNSIITEHRFINLFIPLKKFYLENKNYFNKYDYIYIYEYDQIYLGDLGHYICELNKDNADLIASYVEIVNNNFNWIHYKHYREYIDNKRINDDFEFVLKSCLSFCRISKKYLEMIFSEKYDDIVNLLIYELYVPTIIYNNGGTIKSLNISHNKFDWRNDLNEKTFYYAKLFDNMGKILEMQKEYDHPMWYTRIK